MTPFKVPGTAKEAEAHIDRMLASIQVQGPVRIQAKPGSVTVIHDSSIKTTIKYTDHTHFKVFFKALANIISSVNEANLALNRAMNSISGDASQVYDIQTADSDPEQFTIRSSPCLFADGEYTYNRIRFDRRTGKKSRQKSKRRPEDDAFAKLYFKGRAPIEDLTRASIVEFVDKCDLAPQLAEPLAMRILNDKRLIKDAAVKPLNMTTMAEFGSLKAELRLAFKLRTDKKAPSPESQLRDAHLYHWICINIDGKLHYFVNTTDKNETELFDPKTKVLTYMRCGPTILVVLPSQEIMWCDVRRDDDKDVVNAYAALNKAKSPDSWIPLDSRDVWTREKVQDALARAEWRK